MKRCKTIRRRRAHRAATESGVALLISLFALLLICVVGMALLMATGTDSALTGNYRSANTVYYAALAGVEEGRTRLLSQWPVGNNMNLVTALGLPAGSVPAVGQAWYILNPQPAEVVAPWDTSNPATYPDLEWAQEFPATPLPTTAPGMQQTNSLSAINSPWGQLYTAYKWVRINAITAPSAKTTGVNVDNDTGQPTTPLTFVGNHLSVDQPGPQALEITALASLTMPNGTQSQRMLQYVAAPTSLNLTFPAALALDGNNVGFQGPASPNFAINGADSRGFPGCVPGATLEAAIGYTNTSDPSLGNITGGIVPAYNANYTGFGGTLPNVLGNSPTSLPANLSTPSGADAFAQLVAQNADQTINPSGGPAVPANFSPLMGPGNPMTIAVNGNLDMTGWAGTGYGILVVTGTLTYDPGASWMGIILVIGQGVVVSTAPAGTGEIDGAVLLAQTHDSSGNALGILGPASWTQVNASNGIYYSTCWINAVQKPYTYKVLSFREIPVNGP